jgi:hypothetical protein
MDTNQMSTTITITMTFRAQIHTGLAIAIIRASNTRLTISRALIQRVHQTRAIIIISGGPSSNSSNNNNSHSIKARQLQMVRFIIIIIIIIRIDTGHIFSITREDSFIHLLFLKEIKIVEKKEKMHIHIPFSSSYFKYIYSSDIPGGVRNGKFVILTPLKKIHLNQWNHLDQRKESFLLNLAIVPPPPNTKKLCIFFDQFIFSLVVTLKIYYCDI